MEYIFQVRCIWRELGITDNEIKDKHLEYFQTDIVEIKDRHDSIGFVASILQKLQCNFLDQINNDSSCNFLSKLISIYSTISPKYFKEKEARSKLKEINTNEGSAVDEFIKNGQIMLSILDSTTLWLENYVLHENEQSESSLSKVLSLDKDLLLELYFYGLLSKTLSTFNASKKLKKNNLFYGFKVDVANFKDGDYFEVLSYHPLTYYNHVLVGNQSDFAPNALNRQTNSTDFGIGFKDEFGVEFLHYLAILSSVQKNLRQINEKYILVTKEDLIDSIESDINAIIDTNAFYENFILSKSSIVTQLLNNESVIWKIGSNKKRLDLNPFLQLSNEKILLSHSLIENSIQKWVSILNNGGSAYSNVKDKFTEGLDKRTEDLTGILVERAIEILDNNYSAIFSDSDVEYNTIYGKKTINYGDFDIIYYAKENKELFLIEAKYFSDSLYASAMVDDINKLFKKDGYYDKCRRRYDLIISDPTPMKKFIGADENEAVKTHFIFLSSKPIEIELQDDDKIVTFLCYSLFDQYIKGKLENTEEDKFMRPVHLI